MNEAFQYYKFGGSNMHSVSLDAAKAFDKLWRIGLFYKLIDYVDPIIWRILFNYYSDSFIIVCINGLLSKPFRKSNKVVSSNNLSVIPET